MNVRYRVELSQRERAELRQLLSGGKQPVRKLKRAQILLAADEGVSDEDIVVSRICARLSLRTGCLPPLRSCRNSARSRWLSSTR